MLIYYDVGHFFNLCMTVAVIVNLPMDTSFSEGDGSVQVCATLTGMTAIPIDLTVSATDGKSHMQEGSLIINVVMEFYCMHDVVWIICCIYN